MLAALRSSPDSARSQRSCQPTQARANPSSGLGQGPKGSGDEDGDGHDGDDDDETLWQGLPDWDAELSDTQLGEVLSGASNTGSSQLTPAKRTVEGVETPSKRARLEGATSQGGGAEHDPSSPVAEASITQHSVATLSTIQATATRSELQHTFGRPSPISPASVGSPSKGSSKQPAVSPIEEDSPSKRAPNTSTEDGVEQVAQKATHRPSTPERERDLLKAVGWGSPSGKSKAENPATPPPPASFELFDPGNPWTQVPRGTQAERRDWIKQWDDDWRKERRDVDASSDAGGLGDDANGRSREASHEEQVELAHARATQVLARASTSPSFCRREAIEVLYRAPETRSPGSARRPLLSEMDEARKRKYLRQFDRMEGVARSDDEGEDEGRGWDSWAERGGPRGGNHVGRGGAGASTSRGGHVGAALVESPARGQVTLASRGAAAQGGISSPAAGRGALRGGAQAAARTPKTWASTWGTGAQESPTSVTNGRGRGKGARGRGGGRWTRGARRARGRSATS